MKVKVDNRLPVSLFGQAAPQPDSIRYYYQVPGYDCLVLVCHDRSYVEWCDQIAVALWNFDTVRGDIICEQFPDAPASWRDHDALVQCTIRSVHNLPPGRPMWLSDAVRSHLGGGC